MKTIRIRSGSSDDTKIKISTVFSDEKDNIEIGWFDGEEEPTTLRDLSLLVTGCMGQGVHWQLASELSNRLDIHNPGLVNHMLMEIFFEYSELSDEEAYKRWDNMDRLYDPMN